MAPCRVSALSASRPPAEVTCAFAAAACSSESGSPASTEAAAKYTTDRAASTSTSIVAAACLTAWKEPIGTPNWCRCLLYSTASSSIRAVAPSESAATSTAARAEASPRNSAAETSSGRASTASSRMSATVRVRSSNRRLLRCTPDARASTRYNAAPTGTTNRRAVSPASTLGTDPLIAPERSIVKLDDIFGIISAGTSSAAHSPPSVAATDRPVGKGGHAEHGGQPIRRRSSGPGQLLRRQGQFDDATTLSANGFGKADTRPAVGNEPPGERRRVVRAQPVPHDVRRRHIIQPATKCSLIVLLFLGELPLHGSASSPLD